MYTGKGKVEESRSPKTTQKKRSLAEPGLQPCRGAPTLTVAPLEPNQMLQDSSTQNYLSLNNFTQLGNYISSLEIPAYATQVLKHIGACLRYLNASPFSIVLGCPTGKAFLQHTAYHFYKSEQASPWPSKLLKSYNYLAQAEVTSTLFLITVFIC